MRRLKSIALAAGLVAVSALPAMAQTATGPDLTPLTSAISFTTVIAAILATMALVVGAVLAFKGAQWVLKAVKAG